MWAGLVLAQTAREVRPNLCCELSRYRSTYAAACTRYEAQGTRGMSACAETPMLGNRHVGRIPHLLACVAEGLRKKPEALARIRRALKSIPRQRTSRIPFCKAFAFMQPKNLSRASVKSQRALKIKMSLNHCLCHFEVYLSLWYCSHGRNMGPEYLQWLRPLITPGSCGL